MRQRFRLFKRGTVFYFEDTSTRHQSSLGTKDRGEALRLVEIKRQATANQGFNQLMLKTCLSIQDPELTKRTWATVMDQMSLHGKESTQTRCTRAMRCKAFDRIRDRKLIETSSGDLLAVLNVGKVSVNHYLRRLHNLALGLGWISVPILAPKLWPKPRFKEKRAITLEEQKRILAAETNAERN